MLQIMSGITYSKDLSYITDNDWVQNRNFSVSRIKTTFCLIILEKEWEESTKCRETHVGSYNLESVTILECYIERTRCYLSSLKLQTLQNPRHTHVDTTGVRVLESTPDLINSSSVLWVHLGSIRVCVCVSQDILVQYVLLIGISTLYISLYIQATY